MPDWKILSRSEKNAILALIKTHYGADMDFPYEMLQTPKDKLYLVSHEALEADLEGLRIDKLGIYFGEIFKGEIRFSIEGSQIIGPHATMNVIETDTPKVWLAGHELDIDRDRKGFQIVKSGKDFLGCGKASNGRLFNYISKTRRLGTTD